MPNTWRYRMNRKLALIKSESRSKFERFQVRFPANAVQLWGIKRIVSSGLGSGFRYCKLGRTLLDEFGDINGEVPFTDLARYVYLLETGVTVPKRPKKDCPLLGVHQGRAIYLLYNGVLGDRRPAGGNVLTNSVLAGLPPHPEGKGSHVIFGEATRLSESTLARENIVFRQIPYSLRAS